VTATEPTRDAIARSDWSAPAFIWVYCRLLSSPDLRGAHARGSVVASRRNGNRSTSSAPGHDGEIDKRIRKQVSEIIVEKEIASVLLCPMKIHWGEAKYVERDLASGGGLTNEAGEFGWTR
jgi:hypothetical protein